jgi:adenylylsulfate kinase
MPRPNNLLAPTASISRAQREARNGHRGTAILLTGLPAAGKSTLAQALHAELFEHGVQSVEACLDHLLTWLGECAVLPKR